MLFQLFSQTFQGFSWLYQNVTLFSGLPGFPGSMETVNYNLHNFTGPKFTHSLLNLFLNSDLIIAECAERSEAAELICHLSAWCKMYTKFLPISTYLEIFEICRFNVLVIPKFCYGELNIAQKLAETPPKRYEINLAPKPLYIKDLLISLPPGLCKRPGNEVDIWRFCVLFS